MANILFVFEGAKTEVKHYKNIIKPFFKKNTTFHACFSTNIYQLFDCMNDDDDLDVVELLKEREVDVPDEKFAEIYLFFDYDPQDENSSDEKISEMLKFFDNETEVGKLYVSYPMFEALKDIPNVICDDGAIVNNLCQDGCFISLLECCNYKKIVSNRSCYIHIPEINKYKKKIFNHHIKKANCIVNDQYNFPESIEALTQFKIFRSQVVKYIPNDRVAILSPLPLFVFEYFGVEKTNELLS